jgi:hypothetical protein
MSEPKVGGTASKLAAQPNTPTNLIEAIHCPQCDERAYIIRRTTDGFKRDGSEVWTFQCVNSHNTEKSGQR